MTRIAQAHKRAEQRLKAKALLPEERFCRILRKRVTVLVEYDDYRSHWNKGDEGAIYCESIVDCYQNNIQCRYSGISPLYPDPFEGVPRNVKEAEELFGVAEAEEPAQPEARPEEEPEETITPVD